MPRAGGGAVGAAAVAAPRVRPLRGDRQEPRREGAETGRVVGPAAAAHAR